MMSAGIVSSSFAQQLDQASPQAVPTWKEVCQKLPYSGWSTLELQKAAQEGDYMAALVLARHWMLQGDMGVSYVSKTDVFSTYVEKLPATIKLSFASILVSILLSVPYPFYIIDYIRQI